MPKTQSQKKGAEHFVSGRVTPRPLMSCLESNRRNTDTINYQAHRILFASTQTRLSNLSIWPCTIQNEILSNHILQSRSPFA